VAVIDAEATIGTTVDLQAIHPINVRHRNLRGWLDRKIRSSPLAFTEALTGSVRI